MPTKAKLITKKMRIAREIAKRNKAFAAASPAERRVLIATDVIAQIKAKKFEAKEGTWVTPVDAKTENVISNLADEFGGDASLRELMLAGKLKCDCCALGAMFMSCTLYNNRTTADDFEHEIDYSFDDRIESGDGFKNQLHRVFSRTQMELIEATYEGNCGAFRVGGAKADRVHDWQDKYPDAKNRLIAIMHNIIKNKGKFIP